MKLKSIPKNIVVHTPTEAEAKELLAILHENGYIINFSYEKILEANRYSYANPSVVSFLVSSSCYGVLHSPKEWFGENDYTILTIAEFKRLYCEEEKPQPKFKVGDMVMIDGVTNLALNHHVGSILELPNIDHPSTYKVGLADGYSLLEEVYLTSYTEPESKPTEDMETKEKESGEKGNSFENYRLNLCELLKGHEGETFYSIIAGKCRLKEINEGAGFPICIILDACTTWEYLTKDGKRFNVSDARCILYPSRTLYEQYPLDPYTAWMKWQEGQLVLNRIFIAVNDAQYDPMIDAELYFRTPADRDKCIEEIKEIIEKYSKK